jgi:hypothetical protein
MLINLLLIRQFISGFPFVSCLRKKPLELGRLYRKSHQNNLIIFKERVPKKYIPSEIVPLSQRIKYRFTD